METKKERSIINTVAMSLSSMAIAGVAGFAVAGDHLWFAAFAIFVAFLTAPAS
jgi:hypothetical protein